MKVFTLLNLEKGRTEHIRKNLASGNGVPTSTVALQCNEQFKGVKICSEIKGQEQYT